ncbi:MAG: hypothetical protein QM652_00015 [Legionella sp.]
MSKENKFKHESQDARRHDQQHAVHPSDKMKKHHEKAKDNKKK